MKEKKPDPCTLPELAKKLRAFRGKSTQAAVSSAAGKNTATYTYWEAGATEPGALALTKACLFMGCTPNDVLLRGKTSSLGEDLPPVIYNQLLEILRDLVELHAHTLPGRPSPITVFHHFLRDAQVALNPAATQPRSRGRRKNRKAGDAAAQG